MMAAGWDADAMKALIGIRGQENVKSQLDSVTRNRVIYEKIAQGLEAEGYVQSWQQCRTNRKTLRRNIARYIVSYKLDRQIASRHNCVLYVAPMCTRLLDKIGNACCHCCWAKD